MSSNLENRYDDPSRIPSTLNVLAGIWLIISGWLVGFSGASVPLGNAVIVGIAVLVLAAIRMNTVGTTGLSWINFLLGIWLIISPFVLRFSQISGAMSNAIMLGILVAMFGLWAALASHTAVRSIR